MIKLIELLTLFFGLKSHHTHLPSIEEHQSGTELHMAQFLHTQQIFNKDIIN